MTFEQQENVVMDQVLMDYITFEIKCPQDPISVSASWPYDVDLTYDVASDQTLRFVLPEVELSPSACFTFEGYEFTDKVT